MFCRETAPQILNDYLASLGGKEAIMEAHEEKLEAAKKGKKRARSSTGVDTPSNGTKRGRKGKNDHPLDTTPPASASREFAPPTGNWEEEVRDIDACEGKDGKPIVFVTWKNGNKSQHPLAQIYKRCPQKMLQFYERHLWVQISPYPQPSTNMFVGCSREATIPEIPAT